MLATFMEVLDSTVVNVSLPHIGGNLSVSTDEVTWVITSYLVSNAIVLPATGWLSQVFGRKRLYMTCVGLFAFSSFLCGLAPSLTWLVFFRIMQGLGGGAMQPISQAILLESFPLRRRGMGMAIFGVGVVFAPVIGPTLGGWITDVYSWRWIFFINVPIGLLSLFLTQLFVADPPYLKRGVGRIDAIGLGLLALGIGTLQYVLDQGQRADWFQTSWVVQVALLSATSLIMLVIWESRTRQPVIDLRIFRVRNYSPAVILIFALGVTLYGSLVLIPLFLQNLLGYTATQSGLAMSPGGIGTLLFMPLVGFMVGRYDVRAMIIFGLLMLIISMFMAAQYTLDINYWDIVEPRIIMGIGLAFLFVPLATVMASFLPKEKIGTATGIFNLMRNLGGSVGIALVTTLLAKRSQFHQERLIEHLNPFDPAYQQAFQAAVNQLMAQGVPSDTAQQQALGIIYGQVQRQATLLAFVDCFWVLGVAMIISVALVFIMRRPPSHARTTPPGAH